MIQTLKTEVRIPHTMFVLGVLLTGFMGGTVLGCMIMC